MKYVYLIRYEEKDGSFSYKIGYTKNVEDRLKQLKTANPNKLEIFEKFNSSHPSKLERYLHSIFKHKCIDGEWFKLDNDDIKKFKSTCIIMEKNYKVLEHNPFF